MKIIDMHIERSTINPKNLTTELTSTLHTFQSTHANAHTALQSWVILDIDRTVITDKEKLIDPNLPAFLRGLAHTPNTKFVFLTARRCNSKSTLRTLKMLETQLGITEVRDNHTCQRLHATSEKTCLCSKSGMHVMFTGGQSKGTAINRWFALEENKNEVVNHIIFADDQKAYLKDVERDTRVDGLKYLHLLKMDFKPRIEKFMQSVMFFTQ